MLLLLLLSPLLGVGQKINGINFVGTPKPVAAQDFDAILRLGANHVCFVPFAYTRDGEANLTWQNLDWQWWGESLEGVRQCVRLAHSKGLKTIVKPQVWIGHGSFTGDFSLKSDKDWKTFENAYRNYILSFVKMAESEKVELFCVGTEFCAFVTQRPEFWSSLIREIREIYSGKLTYASNWDSFDRVPFWNLLDYVGVDAYFPISEQSTPKLKTLMMGWQEHYEQLQQLSERIERPILFTEYGYRSVDFCAREPWLSDRSGAVNADAQYNAYRALFMRFWEQEWFAGGLLWKWFPDHNQAGGPDDNRFTPQNKPAESLIKEWYRKG